MAFKRRSAPKTATGSEAASAAMVTAPAASGVTAPGRRATDDGRGVNAPTSGEASGEEIRRRAYEIFLSRNGGAGSAESDWLQAERELRAGRGGERG